MPEFQHKGITGLNLHEAFHYVQSTDPGRVGAGLYWLDTTIAPFVLHRRASDNNSWVAIGSPTIGGEVNTPDVVVTGLTGAVHQARYAGATTGGPPSTGTWQQGDVLPDYNAKLWICTANGAPGTWKQAGGDATFDVLFGGSGAQLTNGIKGDVRINQDLNLTGWYLYADAVGQFTVDIWKATHATFPPTVLNSIISAGTLPFLNGTDHGAFASLSGWTTLLPKGSILRFNVSGAASVSRVTLMLEALKV